VPYSNKEALQLNFDFSRQIYTVVIKSAYSVISGLFIEALYKADVMLNTHLTNKVTICIAS